MPKATGARRLAAVAALALPAVACPLNACAEHVDYTIEFSRQDLVTTERNGYDVFELEGCDLTSEPGAPQLPLLAVTLALPDGASPLRLEVVGAQSGEFAGPYEPFPAQEPAILPIPGAELPPWRFTEPRRSIYRGTDAYPAELAEISSVGRLGGNTAVGLRVHPLQYLPSTGKLRFFNRIDLRLHYEGGAQPGETARERTAVRRLAHAVLQNDADVFAPRDRLGARESLLDPGDFEYVVITDAANVAAFEPLAEWKTRKGVPATVVTVDWIDATYEGDDTQSRIRAFVTDAYESWGTSWVLLGGDTQTVPARRAYAMTSEAGFDPIEDQIGCDLYYGDLDGTWDLNGNGTFGEIADDVDLYPDVIVGRAPVRDADDTDAFVSKVLAYEQSPPSGLGPDMLMAAEVLWSDPFTDSGVALNMIDRDYVPPRFDPITKLYETLGNETAAAVLGELNAGPGHFLHSGHAWYTVMGCGAGYIGRQDASGLTNGLRTPIVYSIGCWPAAFDLDDEACIAEHFLRNPSGGAVAFIGNDRYGWASPGNPGYGYSERFMQTFYDVLFVRGERSLGAVLAQAKAELVPLSGVENVYRWHQYELNLLGDPEMPVWTDEPENLEVTHTDSVSAGASVFDVSVWTSSGPVSDALVCLRGGSETYERATTGAQGTASLEIEVAGPESLDLTVTAPDCLPYTARVGVSFTGAFVSAGEMEIDDGLEGNDDGMAGPGETFELSVSLRNEGDESASDVDAVLTSDDPLVEVLEGTAHYGDIAPGADSEPTSAFSLSVDPTCPDAHVALLDLTVSEGDVRTVWPEAVSLTVSAPVASVAAYSVDDTRDGDGDGSPEPGEGFLLMVDVRNRGGAPARSPVVEVASLDPYLSVVDGTVGLDDVAPGDGRQCVFEMSVSPGCPLPSFPEIELELTTSFGYSSVDTFAVAVGRTGMTDDFESGAPGWTHGGEGDLWTLSDNRSHSGATSWYSGGEGWQYDDGMDASLVSPEFVAGVDTELRFWMWYEFPIYHEDGLYVEILQGNEAVDTLDFIGSGGALNHLGSIGNTWLEYGYSLERDPGETLSVRFRLSTDDADVAEGVYLDDVVVTSGVVPTETGAEPASAADVPALLRQNRPNPFTSSTTIAFTMFTEAPVALSVYNIQGRLIRTVLEDVRGRGDHSMTWDGKDELGVDVAAGVYLYRLSVADYEDTGKMILVR